MKENILEMLSGQDIGDDCLADKITNHVMEFIEWINNSCASETFLHEGSYQFRWFIIKNIDQWDGEPETTYSTEELYTYWLNNVKQ